MQPDEIIVPSVSIMKWDTIILKQPWDNSDHQEEFKVEDNYNWQLLCINSEWELARLSWGFYVEREDWWYEPIILNWK